jgi:hypothetical protein
LITDAELIQSLEKQKNLMISVATGGPRIDSVNADYKAAYSEADRELRDRGIENPNPYSDLKKIKK